MYPKGLLCKIFQHNKGIKHTKNFKTGGPQIPRRSSDPVPWTISVNLPRVELLNFYWKEHGDSTCAGLVCVLRSYKTYFMYPQNPRLSSTCLFFVCQHGFNCLLKQITLVLWAHVCLLCVNMGLHELVRQKWFRQRMV